MSDLAPLGLHHIALRVGDVERSLAFYAGTLGMPERRRFDSPEGGLRSAWVDEGVGVVLMLERQLKGTGAAGGSGHLLAFAVRDLAATERRLAAAGIVADDRTPHTLYFRDPDGHRVGLSDFVFRD